MDDPSLDSGSTVYHGPDRPGEAVPTPAIPIQDRPRAFYIDVYTDDDDDSDATEHAYYGVTNPAGGAVARSCAGNGVHLIADPARLAARLGGTLIWV